MCACVYVLVCVCVGACVSGRVSVCVRARACVYVCLCLEKDGIYRGGQFLFSFKIPQGCNAMMYIKCMRVCVYIYCRHILSHVILV